MSVSTEVKIYADSKDVVKALSKEIYKLTKSSVQDRFNILLSGGNTPRELFKKIAKKYPDSIKWARVHFWWGDERCVSPDNENSNFKQAQEFLLSQIVIPMENIHRIKGENNPDEEAIRLFKNFEKIINDCK